MAHVAKYKASAIGHMANHYGRSDVGEKADYITRSNENINPERTHLNYNLAQEDQKMPQIEFIHQRLSEVKVQKRADVNVMCDWVITAPKDLLEWDNEPFFRASYDFLKNRYGKKNVISSYVHMDEVTPHMHFSFVPVVYDKKKDRYKVSAKEVLTRRDLQSFHKDLQDYVGQKLGYSVGILNNATIEGNQSIQELKQKSAIERLREATHTASEIVSKAQKRADGINDSLIPVRAEYEAKKAYIRQADELSDVSELYPKEVKITEKGLINKKKFVIVPAELWENRQISVNEKMCLKKANEELESNLKEFQSTASAKNITNLKSRIQALEKENAGLNRKNRELTGKLRAAEENVERICNKIDRVVHTLPEEYEKQFTEEWMKTSQRQEIRGEIMGMGHGMSR